MAEVARTDGFVVPVFSHNVHEVILGALRDAVLCCAVLLYAVRCWVVPGWARLGFGIPVLSHSVHEVTLQG